MWLKQQGYSPRILHNMLQTLSMLESITNIKPAFVNSLTNQPKLIECIRVDGATDKGPSHQEIQFWWTLHNLQRPTVVTLVTSRNSDVSYLNRVELQNGCLALAHANLFIPSNVHGTCSPLSMQLWHQEPLIPCWTVSHWNAIYLVS